MFGSWPNKVRISHWQEDEENSAKIEYVDELGRTRMGTRKEARAAAQLRRKDLDAAVVSTEPTSSYAEVL